MGVCSVYYLLRPVLVDYIFTGGFYIWHTFSIIMLVVEKL
jgi:hypothetical protein